MTNCAQPTSELQHNAALSVKCVLPVKKAQLISTHLTVAVARKQLSLYGLRPELLAMKKKISEAMHSLRGYYVSSGQRYLLPTAFLQGFVCFWFFGLSALGHPLLVLKVA